MQSNNHSVQAMLQLGDMAVEQPNGPASNADYAEHWYLRAAAGTPPRPDALFQLARIYHEGLVTRPCDSPKAVGLYRRAAAEGSSAAQYLLGHCSHHGDAELGVQRSISQALHYLQNAAAQEHPEALFYLAQLYRSGDTSSGNATSHSDVTITDANDSTTSSGSSAAHSDDNCSSVAGNSSSHSDSDSSSDSEVVAIQPDAALFQHYLQRAVAAGSADAQFAQGDLCRAASDGVAALHWFELAAAQGHPEASYNAGVLRYAVGQYEAAFEHYQRAVEGGYVLAWREIAAMYLEGKGVPQSEATAKHIMQVCAASTNSNCSSSSVLCIVKWLLSLLVASDTAILQLVCFWSLRASHVKKCCQKR
jgi:TPR repeat protein